MAKIVTWSWRVVLFVGLVALFPHITRADQTATLSLSPASGSYTVGTPFTVDIRLDTGGQKSTVAGVVLNYTNMDYVSFDASSSVYTTALGDPKVANGSITIERARIDAGFSGTGSIGKITFKPTQAGNATLTFDQANSQIIQAEAPNGNILKSVTNASYTIAAPQTATATPTPTPKPKPSATASPATVKYVKNVTVTPSDSGATFSFTTTTALKATVYYGTSSAIDSKTKKVALSSYSGSAADDSATTSHTVTLSNLSPDTRYYYTIALSNGSQENEATFTTPATAPAPTVTPVPTIAPVSTPSSIPVTDTTPSYPWNFLMLPAFGLLGVLLVAIIYVAWGHH